MKSLKVFLSLISEQPEVDQVILFGSLVRNEMTEASDVDVAVIIDDDADLRTLKERLRSLKRSSLSWPCDLIVMAASTYEARKNFGGICMEIAKTGQKLYQKTKL
jgi:predicted nucleotidyltransferase